MFFPKSEYTNTLSEELKKNPNLPIEQILSNSELMISVRNELPELTLYFEKNNGAHLQELFEIALTSKLNNDRIDFRHNRNASNILSSPSRSLQKIVLDNPITIKCLNSFMKESTFYRDTSFSGHFKRIIQSLLYFTNGAFVEQLTGLFDFLIQNIDLTSYRNLIIILIVDFPGKLKDRSLLFEISKIINSTKEQYNISAVFLLSEIMRERPDFPFLYKKEIIENLVKKAASIKDNDGTLLYFEIFNVLRLITNNSQFNQIVNLNNSIWNTGNSDSNSDGNKNSTSSNNEIDDDQERNWVNEIMSKYVKEFAFETGKANERSYSAFPFFSIYIFMNYSPNPKNDDKNITNIYLDQILKIFFQENPPTQFILSFLSGIDKMKEESLLAFIENNNILRKIIDSNIKMPYESVNGATSSHIFNLALSIFNRKLDAAKYNLKSREDKSVISVSSREWSLYLATEILNRNDMIKDCFERVNKRSEYSDDSYSD